MRATENFLKYKHLLWELVSRDLKTKYRRSVLGFLWSLLNPLLMMLVMSIVFSYLFRFQIENFTVYVLCGQIIFNFNNEATMTAMTSVISGGALIKKVYIPKYIFPLSKVISAFVNLLFALVAVVIMLIITKTPIKPSILLFPIPLIYTFVFSLGLGLLLSVVTVFFRDMMHLYGVVIAAWMYMTPLFYPADIIPQSLDFVLTVNPLFHFITYFRMLILDGVVPSVEINLKCIAFGVVMLLIGIVAFYKNQDKFVLHI